jgi:hypothetical protein
MTAIINISDTFFSCYNSESPRESDIGFAYLQDKQPVICGRSALPYFKTQPGKMNTRFWHELNTTPIDTNALHVRHHADLAWHQIKQHVKDLDKQDVALMVSSHYSQSDLSLLAGICQSLQLRVSAMIDRSVVSALHFTESGYAKSHNGPLAYVEIQQHQSILVFFEIADNALQISRVETFASEGLIRVYDKYLHLIRQKFIHNERFDPLHHGQTEQQLFEQIQAIDTTSGNVCSFTVEHDNNEYKLDVANDELIAIITPFLRDIYARAGNSPILFDSAFRRLLMPNLRQQDCFCEHKQLFSNAQHILLNQQNRDSGPNHICEVNLGSFPHSKPEHSKHQQRLPSHILLAGEAFPVGTYRFIDTMNEISLVPENNLKNAHITEVNNTFCLGERASELYINGKRGQIGAQLLLKDTLSMSDSATQLNPAQAIAIREKALQ